MAEVKTLGPTVVGQRFSRSVRIQTDWRDDTVLSGYVATAQVRQVLERLIDGLAGLASERAWTITGPYGTGKSAFALFLARLLSDQDPDGSEAWRLLRRCDVTLTERLLEQLGDHRLLPVLITARRAPLSQCLLEAFASTADEMLQGHSDIGLRQKLRTELEHQNENQDDRGVIECLRLLSHEARRIGYRGVLLIVDELGKILEYTAKYPAHGDVFLLQELAEYASRSADEPVLLLGVLHQAFEQYAQHLDMGMRREWVKVQGRFADIAFLEPPEQLMRLAAEATRQSFEPLLLTTAVPEDVISAALTPELGLCPPGLKPVEFAEFATHAYPLHPALLAVLPYLFRRFAQNERSLFTYLLSQEPFGLQEQVHQRGTQWVRVPDLFDYVMANLGAGMHRHAIHQRWLEVVDTIEESPDLSELQVDIIKTVGVLGVLVEGSHLRASPHLISFALRDQPDAADVAEALQKMEERSLLTYRRFNGSYRVWEGSDVDIEARLEEAHRKTAGQFSLSSVLQRYLPSRPLVARRHSYEVGALRFFDVVYLDEPLKVGQIRKRAGVDGVVACCLSASTSQVDAFRRWAESSELANRADIIVALPEQLGQLQEATAELVALHWVREHTPSLRDDRVARRELHQRLADIESIVIQAIDRLLDPRPAPIGFGCAWYWRGERYETPTPRATTELLSTVMDVLYPQASLIWNELINRRTLSSSAAAARRVLVERMITAGDQPRLGIEGYPPERAMYESVLAATGLHRPAQDRWGFRAPEDDNDPCRLSPIWREMERLVFAAVEEPYPIQKLFKRLSEPPFGVMAGVLPVLLCAFLQANPDEISFYRESAFVPEPGIADYEILMRRPELFALGGARLVGERRVVVERLAKDFDVRPSLLPVVRALIRLVRSLPDHAWRTRRLPTEVVSVRDAFQKSKSPERLLFHDLPLALGSLPFTETDSTLDERVTEFRERLNWALQELNSITAVRIVEAQGALVSACGLSPQEDGWERLRTQARALEPSMVAPTLLPFLKRLSTNGEDPVVLESVLALVANRPPRAWTDADVERFPKLAAQFGERFREATAAQNLLSPKEEAQTQALTQRIRMTLGKDVPPHVARTALQRLLSQL